MASINQVILLGNVGGEPKVVNYEGGKLATFALATSECFIDRQGEAHEKTEWHSVITYGSFASVVENYVRKGAQLAVIGSLRTRKWSDQNGQNRYTTEIVASSIQLLGKKEQTRGDRNGQDARSVVRAAAAVAAHQNAEPAQQEPDDGTNDLPF
ncbi:MAG: single-stranded DNA-binding protein [Bacteroidales bacterium]|nr:single-stranded DNA-binding protein [Bacteroidales bacterium]